ncbi:MAG TPA: zinc-dependent metalloprotease family protein [Rubricoccaceae bacterium]|nr:zinc-dependent metalloprotease family protein [Rubricoccaceae bacterium]
MNIAYAFRFLAFPLTVLLAALSASTSPQAQPASLWSDVGEHDIPAGRRLIVPTSYRTIRLDRTAMEALLRSAPEEVRPGDTREGIVLSLPLPEGGSADFRVIESSILAPALQARYPQMRTYLGRGLSQPAATVRISMTPSGFRAQVFAPDGAYYIDPYAVGNATDYLVYRGSHAPPDPERVRAAFEHERVEETEVSRTAEPPPMGALRNGETLRTYRLALATTGEYTRFHSADPNNPTVEEGMDAVVVAMARVNQIYENDVAVRMVLIPNNDTLIYLDPNTDPYTNNNGSAMLSQNQATIDAVIGPANYDIGHVFSTGGGGVAGLGVVCSNGVKARGVTGLPTPIGDPFYVDYVAHEMGHQYRGNHSFNGTAGACGGGRVGQRAYEPGSGSTIMAYAGICGGHNLQSFSDPYFHVISLDEIVSFITFQAGSTCPTNTPTGNVPPTVTATGGYALPVRTPFTLSGSATDDTPASLTYIWEEFDLGPGGSPVSTTPPLFRSFNPTPAGNTRVFPRMDRLLAGQPPIVGENYPVDSRELRFRLIARDNALAGGGIADTLITVTTHVEAGPFLVTTATSPGQTFPGGTPVSVTWDVAGTNAGPVNTAAVDILYSTNNGVTFDHVLAAATPNDGAETVTFPNMDTAQGRLLIRAVGNVFFNVSPFPFTVTMTTATESPAEGAFSLSAAYPNPIPREAAVRVLMNLSVDRTQRVSAEVYDALGRRVAVLHEGLVAAGANAQLVLDARALPAGSYFVRVTGETFTATRPLQVIQ